MREKQIARSSACTTHKTGVRRQRGYARDDNRTMALAGEKLRIVFWGQGLFGRGRA
jgi:hypothetical protein